MLSKSQLQMRHQAKAPQHIMLKRWNVHRKTTPVQWFATIYSTCRLINVFIYVIMFNMDFAQFQN